MRHKNTLSRARACATSVDVVSWPARRRARFGWHPVCAGQTHSFGRPSAALSLVRRADAGAAARLRAGRHPDGLLHQLSLQRRTVGAKSARAHTHAHTRPQRRARTEWFPQTINVLIMFAAPLLVVLYAAVALAPGAFVAVYLLSAILVAFRSLFSSSLSSLSSLCLISLPPPSSLFLSLFRRQSCAAVLRALCRLCAARARSAAGVCGRRRWRAVRRLSLGTRALVSARSRRVVR